MVKILIADDDRDICTIMSDALNAQNLQTVVAFDGDAALALAVKESPDLIILDISMPNKSGYDVLRELRKSKALANLPVIACTAHALKGDEERIRAAGFNGYLPKPFDLNALTAEINRLLPR